jgi:hypothetical protein
VPLQIQEIFSIPGETAEGYKERMAEEFGVDASKAKANDYNRKDPSYDSCKTMLAFADQVINDNIK